MLERHGGTVEKFIGDAVMAVFGIPTVHEDDALRAVRAAAEMRDSLASLNAELEHERGVRLEIRTGVNTGEVVAGDPSQRQSFATGDAVNVAARFGAGGRAGRDRSRRGDLPTCPGRRPGRACRAARPEGEGERCGRMAPRRGPRGRAPVCAPLRLAAHRASGRARGDALRLRRGGRAALASADDCPRGSGGRKVAPDERVRHGCGAKSNRARRPLPFLRRGDHVLATRPDDRAPRGAGAAARAARWDRGRRT